MISRSFITIISELMQKKCDAIQQNWLEISRSINELLENPVECAEEINHTQEWLKRHLQKIVLHRNQNDQVVIRSLADHNIRQDSLLICDSSFRIHNYSGIHNFFSDLEIDKDKPFSVLDLVEEKDQIKLKSAFQEAVRTKQNVQQELRIKTNSEVLSHCILNIDMTASNPANDRYVVGVKFAGVMAGQLLEYQSLIMDALPGVDIYLFDKNYNYLFVGGKEKERFSLSNVEMIGKSVFEALDKKAVRLIYPYINKAMQGALNEGEIRYNNEIYYLQATPVKNFSNETTAVILFSQNITQDKLIEEQLKRGKEEALKADELKSIFIANLSHEIRTPLNAIIGFSEQLDKTVLNDEQLKYNGMIKKASDYLLYLVTEVVFLFKLGMGKVFIEKTPFFLTDLFDELHDIFSKQAAEKQLSLTFEFSDDFPTAVVGDSYRVRQILSNLLSNAIKYTDKGEIKLEGKLRKEYKTKVELQFSVSDTGIGISRKYLKKIFDVFEQGTKFNIAFRSGAGLGLGICKRLTELLNGKIHVSSKLNVGSTFTVMLPFPKIKSLGQIPKKEKQFVLSEDHNLLVGKKVLLADDDEHNLLLSENILKRWRTDYTLVNNGEKAIDMLKRVKFDLVIVDIHMPLKSGLEVARFLHSDSNPNSETPIFFITANAFHTDIHNYLKEGFDGYLIKPFKEVDFYSKLCNVLDLGHPEKKSKQTEPAISKEIQDSFRTDGLLKTADGDRKFYDLMIKNFIQSAESLKQLFEQAEVHGNWQEVGEKAHKSITSFKYFGLLATAGLLEKIEDHTVRELNTELAKPVLLQALEAIDKVIAQAKINLIG